MLVDRPLSVDAGSIEWRSAVESRHEVLRVLRAGGDRADALRPIRVRMAGHREAIEAMRRFASDLQWTVGGSGALDPERQFLDLERSSPTDALAVGRILYDVLKLECAYAVRLVAWGTEIRQSSGQVGLARTSQDA